MRDLKDVIMVWTLNIIGYFGQNYDIIAQRVSVTLAIVYTAARLYSWVAEKLKKGKNDNNAQREL